jgi:tetratricopeptide (TPR) repeat protein
MPTTRYLRAYAAAALREGRPREALAALDNALRRDPNNLSTLEAKYKALAATGDLNSAVTAAKALVAVEDTGYFRVRGVPELVPLETYDARVFLADHAPSHAEKIPLLKGAVEGYRSYFVRTVAYFRALIKQSKVQESEFEFLGHNMAEVRDVVVRAKAAAKSLEDLYRELGDVSSAEGVSKVAESFSAE